MTETWNVAAVQMDCLLGQPGLNLAALYPRMHEAADRGARLIVFPECILTGYGFGSRAELAATAQTVPGPATNAVASVCRERGVFVVFGLIERAGEQLFNSCALVGPEGLVATYRKIHLPCVGADRFTDPGDRPFAVHDIGGLKVGMAICFDAGFVETCRVLTLLGADVIVLPTNWADKAIKNATLVSRVRAFENHVDFVAVNRIGTESGFHYVGHSSIIDFHGDFRQFAEHDREEILVATLDPAATRTKKIVHCVGEYEIDRVNWRRPEMYGPLTTTSEPFPGHYRR